MNCIEVKDVSKGFGSVEALRQVSLRFEERKIYGLLGRNGAGKSTLLNIIANRIFADTGEVLINGMPAAENDRAQSLLYLMSEQTLYPEKMKVREAFKWTRNFYPSFDTACAQELSARFGLDTKKKVKALSTGYSSIFKIVIALSVGTPYILLDEPVLGLDAGHRELFYKALIERYSANPCTVILSTHLIEEAAGVIEDIVIIKEGKVIQNESCESLLSKGYTISGRASAVDDFIRGKEIIGTDSLGGLKTAYILGPLPQGGLPEGLELSGLDLQKLFVQLTNS